MLTRKEARDFLEPKKEERAAEKQVQKTKTVGRASERGRRTDFGYVAEECPFWIPDELREHFIISPTPESECESEVEPADSWTAWMAGFFPWPACHLPSCPCVTRIRYGGMAEAALHSPYHGQGGRRTRHLELRRRVLIEGKVGQRADENRRQCKEFGAARFLDQVIEPFLLEKGFVATSPGNAPGNFQVFREKLDHHRPHDPKGRDMNFLFPISGGLATNFERFLTHPRESFPLGAHFEAVSTVKLRRSSMHHLEDWKRSSKASPNTKIWRRCVKPPMR
ncbi:unnamed protein product [Effrenium voratum]|nr:unnamed protein product [Effrenium voratum]